MAWAAPRALRKTATSTPGKETRLVHGPGAPGAVKDGRDASAICPRQDLFAKGFFGLHASQ